MENSNDTMHLFAGAGGGLLADLILGKRPIIAVEWDKYACSVLRARAEDGWFPDLSVWEGDVRMFDPSEYAGKVDCIHAGFPCQDISVAGKQSGIGEGTRSGLYREVIRIASIVRPRHIFLENVAAITSKSKGYLEIVCKDLSEIGYDCRWTTLSAAEVGANHKRDRWWLLAKRSEQQQEGVEEAERMVDTLCNGCEPTKGWGTLPDLNRINQSNEQKWENQQQGIINTSELANSSNKRLQGCEITGNNGKDRAQSRHEQPAGCSSGNEWNAVESDVGRVAHDVADRVGKLKALGNGQVPLQAAVAYSILEELFT